MSPQRIDYYDSPEAPKANSLVPSVKSRGGQRRWRAGQALSLGGECAHEVQAGAIVPQPSGASASTTSGRAGGHRAVAPTRGHRGLRPSAAS